MPPEYNKSHIQGILNENGKNTTLHIILYCFFREAILNTLGFIKFPNVENNKIKCFLAFGDLIKPLLSFLKYYFKNIVLAEQLHS